MKYIIFLSFLFFIPVSQAEIHIEPYVTGGVAYSSSISSSNESSFKSSSDSFFMTFGLGGRFGYSFSLVNVGLDLFWTHYNTGRSVRQVRVEPSDKKDEGSHVYFSELPGHFQPFSIGLFTSVDLPFLFNAYGTVFYSIPAENRNVNYQGYGVKGGLSYLSAFYVQLNLELQWGYYMCTESTDCSKGFNIISALLSVSVPLSTDIFNFGSDPDSEDSNTEENEENSSSDI